VCFFEFYEAVVAEDGVDMDDGAWRELGEGSFGDELLGGVNGRGGFY